MSDPIREALARLSSALDRLDAVSLRHSEGERVRATLETELAVMREDRHTLATLLDDERARQQATEDGLAALSPRIERAIRALETGLEHE